MLNKEKLVSEGINYEEEKETINDMPSLSQNKKPKKKGLFSKAVFLESWKSNRKALSIVSAGNAILLIIIIAIMSTLHINSTSEALSNLFDNADIETSIKSSSVSFYAAFSASAEAYDQYDKAYENVYEYTLKGIAIPSDQGMLALSDNVNTYYTYMYATSTGTEEEKIASAKTSTLAMIQSNISSYETDEQSLIMLIYSNYLDIYAKDNTLASQQILVSATPLAIKDAFTSLYSLEEGDSTSLGNIYSSAFNKVYGAGYNAYKAGVEVTLDVLPVLSSEEFVNEVSTSLEKAYEKDSDAYLSDLSVKDDALISAVTDYVGDSLEENAYYSFLPDYTVEIVTSIRGYPLTYIDGKETELKEYDSSSFVYLNEDMGTKSTALEKMHKEIITGEGYSNDEILKAKEDAKENIKTIKKEINTFLNEFNKRDENGKNSYYNGENIIDEGISSKAAFVTVDLAEDEIIDIYNKSHDEKVSSINEITAENYSMSGEEMMNLVKSYASSGITSYKTYLDICEDKGYDAEESMLVSMVNSSNGVIALLPVSVSDSLEEMGAMNTYGVIVGNVALGIAALLIPMVYTILLSDSLVSNKVQTGSLAFTLSTPITRESYVFTEGAYLVFSETFMFITLFLGAVIAQVIGINLIGSEDLATSLPISDLFFYCLGNYAVTLAVSGICFLSSCHFNKSGEAIGIGGGLIIFFFICSILGLFATKAIPGTIRIEAMNIFNYMTIDSLFDALAVMNGDWFTYWFKLMWLVIIAAATYIIGGIRFTKKDLPL